MIALAGVPNCGKTALFNALTGSRQKVANYPGVTVERKEGTAFTSKHGRIRVLDLPGTYSLTPQSPDEEVTRDVLLGKISSEEAPQVVVAVADALHLARHLTFVLELKATGMPMILALSMMDLAKAQGLLLDLKKLSALLGMPVVATSAVKGEGLKELLAQVEEMLSKSQATQPRGIKTQTASVSNRYAEAEKIVAAVTEKAARPSSVTRRIDAVVLHPVGGILALALMLLLIFQAVFSWAAPFQDWIESAIGWAGSVVGGLLSEGALKSLIVDGIFAGVGSVLVFLPQIIFLFFFILILEDSGYMARAAFLMDRLMSRVGLHGRAFVPLLSSFACAIPGIMAARTIQNPRDRLATILVAPLMTCSARLPVYTLLIGAFIPQQTLALGLGLQGLVLFGLYVAAVVFGLLLAWVFKKTLLKGPAPVFLLELPDYKMPSFRNIFYGLWERARVFVRRAGTVILSLVVALWFLSSYPAGSTLYDSYAGRIGRAMEPALKPIGFDWKISVALVPGFAAREVMVGALATVFAVEKKENVENAEQEQEAILSELLVNQYSLATALSLLVWYIFAPQCLSTLAVTRRETNSWRWPLFMLFYLTALAYLASFLVYRAFL